MRILIPVLLLLFSVGCQCQTENAFKKLWKSHVSKIYNWIPADNEASKYRDKEEESKLALQALRSLSTVYGVAAVFRTTGYHWHKENLDFTSYPWVTIARKRGDCDDWMLLWEAILKYKGGRTKKVSVSSTEGGGHAMLLYYCQGAIYILSNIRVLGKGNTGEEDKLIRLFYKEKTKCFITY